MEQITKTNLASQVVERLRESITRGEIEQGSTLSEVECARTLGVSRTPVREALRQLQTEGFVECRVGRGATVTSLSSDEVRQIYPVIGALERLLLASSPLPDTTRMSRIRRLDRQVVAGKLDLAEAVDLDTRWHQVLLEESTNQRASKIVASLKEQARRYEFVYMQAAEQPGIDEHEAILEALGDGDVDRAGELLEEHWAAGMSLLLRQMKKQKNR